MSFADTIIETLSDASSHHQNTTNYSYHAMNQESGERERGGMPYKTAGGAAAAGQLMKRSSSPTERGESGSTAHITSTRSLSTTEGEDRRDCVPRRSSSSGSPAVSYTAPGLSAKDELEEHHITASDYSDRQRLLYHITYLSTQVQRQQLQLQEQFRTIAILQATAAAAAADSEDNDSETVVLRLPAKGTTAAVLAAQEEAELYAALQTSLASFDPLIAQTQINRLDNALSYTGMLREAELQRLERAEAAEAQLREQRRDMVAKIDRLQGRCAELDHLREEHTTSLVAAKMEVERLRLEEVRLNRRLAAMEDLQGDGGGVRIAGLTAAPHTATLSPYDLEAEELFLEEAAARQALCQDLFWDPMLIAFDAGLTWLSDSAALHAEAEAAAHGPPSPVPVVPENEDEEEDGGALVPNTAGTPPTDADLLLLRHQQEEIQQLRSRAHVVQERLRVAQLEKERLTFLYEGEQRRSEMLAQDHAAQLKRAYEELLQDRQHIMQSLRAEVEEQVQAAYDSGKRHERRRQASRRHAEEEEERASQHRKKGAKTQFAHLVSSESKKSKDRVRSHSHRKSSLDSGT